MKKGITISVLAVTIIIMLIIVGTVSTIGISSINTAAYEEFKSKKIRVADYVNEYYIREQELPIKNEIVSKEGLSSSLASEVNNNGDTNNILYVVDLSKLNIESVNIGRGTVDNMDVFLVSENTHNIYYLKGVSYKGENYY